MFLIQRVTSNPLQKQVLVLEDGTALSLTLYFRPMQYGWFIENLTYKDFVLNGVRVTNSPNMLNQWRNKLPFGLACFSTANREPSLQEDFSSQASKLYILNAAETAQYAEFLSRG
jgi:hypothetical protein